ncbi:MAG TPA: D-glycero-beta-D-manno-heptose 1-phosphate adenylyltransferase [Streptosporangiaceae bacterium]|nr:D-glycero-beta-D-manno-heptose 1-phosphate adenylyltransferase [Streptosporangiaceae bacterium]
MRGGPLVVVGDALLDVDLYGRVQRLVPGCPAPVVDCQRERHRPGGAGLAAVLAARMGGPDVLLITALGQDRPGRRLGGLLAPHVQVLALPLSGGTPCKIRVRAGGQTVARLDAGDGLARPGPVGPRIERALLHAGAVLVADYGRGMTAHPVLGAMLSRLPAATPVVWDPHPAGGRPMTGCRLVTPNQGEAHRFAAELADGHRDAPAGQDTIGAAARDAAVLNRAWKSPVAVTLGEHGALLTTGADVPFLFPAESAGLRQDTCGAGDCFAAAAAQVLRAGGLLTEAVAEAVRWAAGFVREGGASAVPGSTVPSDGEHAGAGPAQPGPARDGWSTVAQARERGGKIVATGGCFDLLHAGHVELLRQARGLGDCLVVCLNSDTSVRALKGPGRPLMCAQDRARVLMALESVDAVVVFDQPTPSAVLDRLRPDVWVKGGDYAHSELAEAEVVRRHGGQVMLLPYLDRHSTSRLVAAARGEAEP